MTQKNWYRYPWAYVVALGACAALFGCSGDSHPAHPKTNAWRILYSPNGEPLNGGSLGAPSCSDAMTHWFDRVDTNHDGVISHDEFMADAQAQFRRMDIDGNGYLVSEELGRFRRAYLQPVTTGPQVNAEPPPTSASTDASSASHAKHKRGAGQGEDHTSNPAAANDIDPVMAADSNLDFKVTPEEFTAHAEKTFLALDGNADGILSRDEILLRCKSQP